MRFELRLETLDWRFVVQQSDTSKLKKGLRFALRSEIANDWRLAILPMMASKLPPLHIIPPLPCNVLSLLTTQIGLAKDILAVRYTGRGVMVLSIPKKKQKKKRLLLG